MGSYGLLWDDSKCMGLNLIWALMGSDGLLWTCMVSSQYYKSVLDLISTEKFYIKLKLTLVDSYGLIPKVRIIIKLVSGKQWHI